MIRAGFIIGWYREGTTEVEVLTRYKNRNALVTTWLVDAKYRKKSTRAGSKLAPWSKRPSVRQLKISMPVLQDESKHKTCNTGLFRVSATTSNFQTQHGNLIGFRCSINTQQVRLFLVNAFQRDSIWLGKRLLRALRSAFGNKNSDARALKANVFVKDNKFFWPTISVYCKTLQVWLTIMTKNIN